MDQTLPKLLKRIASEHSDLPGQYSKNASGEFEPVLFRDYYEIVLDYAAGLLSLGHVRGDHIGLIADNRKEWLHSSMAIMAIGAADVPRGCDATLKEISYILSFSECKTVILENDSQIQKILLSKESLPQLQTLITFEKVNKELSSEVKDSGLNLYSYDEILILGKKWRSSHSGAVEHELDLGVSSEVATIIFTSGTTGTPKGVVLTHENFMTQLEDLSIRIPLFPGNRALCVLPVWHSFERLCEYVILYGASSIIYSKPVGSILLADLAKMNPQLLPSVPRIWESVYDGIFRLMRKNGGISWMLFSFFVNVAIVCSRCERKVMGRAPLLKKSQRVTGAIFCFIPYILLLPLKALGGLLVFKKIRAKLGTGFVGGVSGGGALPPYIDEFFWAVGINVVEGYGLTETAPVVAVRPMRKPIFGTIGTPLSCCQVKIVGDNGVELAPGFKGTVLVKGSNVMQGYYKQPELSAKVLLADGWLDTGDIGYKTVQGEIILRGRKKDTIVLRGGENIEPTPLEMKINESRFISQSVVLGQDQRYLGALIVVNRDEVISWAKENGIDTADFSLLLKDTQIRRMFETEIGDLINSKNGFKLFERINKFVLLEKPFETGVELSAKQEIMRFKLEDLYKKEIHRLFN
ncbi:MAG TPA: AMP-binding protein [Treponemataceae bacterium]|nr:AMP-binding protein [Treponemataceae bacterium]